MRDGDREPILLVKSWEYDMKRLGKSYLCLCMFLVCSGLLWSEDLQKTESSPVDESLILKVRALPEPETLLDRFSYAIGYLISQNYAEGVEFSIPYFAKAMDEVFMEEESCFDQQQLNEIIMEYQTHLQNAEVIANRKEAEAFLNANRIRDGIITTTSGLQYEVLRKGYGVKPSASDSVTVHYRGSLLDGEVFDSSYEGDPLTFALTKVISGWTEGLQLMNVGSRYRLYLHPDLAYGDTGSPPVIEPGALLIFEVELLKVEE